MAKDVDNCSCKFSPEQMAFNAVGRKMLKEGRDICIFSSGIANYARICSIVPGRESIGTRKVRKLISVQYNIQRQTFCLLCAAKQPQQKCRYF